MSLSIIIPAHNEEAYIEKTLKNISEGEIIVVCNACSDNTAEIARKYTNKVIETDIKGVSKARNLGAKEASHNTLVFMDADTYPDKELLKKIKESTLTLGASKVKADSRKTKDRIFMGIKSLYNQNFNHCSGLIFCDKEIFNKIGGFNEDKTKSEDTEFIHRGMKHTSFKVINAFVYTSMRRYEKKGYVNMALFWIRENIKPTKKDYETIR